MKRTITSLVSSLLLIGGTAAQDIVITSQGHFSVGGETTTHEGDYDNSQFVGWATQVEAGQSHRENHAFVEYQIPRGAHALPLVYVHGYGGSGVCWQMTPDGRDGFATLMLRKGWSSYVMDLPGRGRAGRVKEETSVKPVADEMFWFDIWRMGVWPRWNDGVQMKTDSASLSQFFREMTPDLSDHRQDVPALTALAHRLGDHILVTHSAGGVPGWISACMNNEVKGVVAYEPGAFVFPQGEVPERIDGLTGGTDGIPVPMEQWKRLTTIPIVLYFGDYIPEEPSSNLGDENWRVRLQMARKFVEVINRHGGNATLVELPRVGVNGNTHFLMQDLNNDVLATMLDKWLNTNFK